MKRLKKNLMIGITAAAAMASTGCARIDSPAPERVREFMRGLSAAVAENRIQAETGGNREGGAGRAVNESSGGKSSFETDLIEKIGVQENLSEPNFGDFDFIINEPQLLYGPPEIFKESESESEKIPETPTESEIGTEAGTEAPASETEAPAPDTESSSEQKASEPVSENDEDDEDDEGSETIEIVQTEVGVLNPPQLIYGPPSATETVGDLPESGEAWSDPSPAN